MARKDIIKEELTQHYTYKSFDVTMLIFRAFLRYFVMSSFYALFALLLFSLVISSQFSSLVAFYLPSFERDHAVSAAFFQFLGLCFFPSPFVIVFLRIQSLPHILKHLLKTFICTAPKTTFNQNIVHAFFSFLVYILRHLNIQSFLLHQPLKSK